MTFVMDHWSSWTGSRWFAWYPVQLKDGTRAFMEWIIRWEPDEKRGQDYGLSTRGTYQRGGVYFTRNGQA